MWRSASSGRADPPTPSSPNPRSIKTAKVNWIDLYTGPLTWQLRDQAGLLSMIELLRRTHQTAIAIFADGQQYDADPTSCDYRIV